LRFFIVSSCFPVIACSNVFEHCGHSGESDRLRLRKLTVSLSERALLRSAVKSASRRDASRIANASPEGSSKAA